MRNTYILSIDCSKSNLESVDRILENTSDKKNGHTWELCLVEEESDPFINFINVFLDILAGKYDDLAQVGVERDNITIWRYYEYDRECNLEISPAKMKKLGEQGISLCISCWQSSGSNSSDLTNPDTCSDDNSANTYQTLGE